MIITDVFTDGKTEAWEWEMHCLRSLVPRSEQMPISTRPVVAYFP